MSETAEIYELEDGGAVAKREEKTKEWLQVRAIFSAALSSFSASILFNWTSPAIPVLVSDEYPDIDIEAASYLSVIPPVATILTSPCYSFLLNRYGRKRTLLSVAVFHFLSFMLIANAKSIWVFYLSRVLFGMSDVFMFGSLPVYIAEVTTPKVRGTWGNAMMFFIFVGQFLINAVGFYFDIRTTAYIFCAVPLVFFASFVFMPETPYYLVMKERKADARKSLKKLRGVKDVEGELEQITADVRRQMSDPARFRDIFAIPSNRKALFIVLLARGIQQFSGPTAFAVYNQYIFKQAGQDINEGHSAMIFNGILALTTFCGPLVIERIGRNLSMVISCFSSGLALLAEAIYFYLQQEAKYDLAVINWFPIVGMVGYVIAFSVGLSLVPTLLLGELFPTNMRGHASCVMNIAFSLYLSVATKLFQYLMTSFGLFVPFIFFSVCCFAGTLLSYLFIPDTTDKTLEEIQQMLKKGK